MLRTWLQRAALAALAAAVLAGAAGGVTLLAAWWRYRELEPQIVEKMDQYYLNLTVPGREEHLVASDDTFEVPYLASTLAVAAEPTRILDVKDRLIGEFSIQKGQYVRSPDELPVYLKKALVASEDRRFYEHGAVDWRATARAALLALVHLRRPHGTSTITQQLAKQMFTTRRYTLGRKAFEYFCARKIEQKYTKDQILLMYLNFSYFGHGCFGVEAASEYYFGKPASALDVGEAAMLVGIIPNPLRYSPFDSPKLAHARLRTVLGRMARNGYIPDSAIERIQSDFWDAFGRREREPRVSFWSTRVNEAPYLVEFVRRRMLADFSKERLLKGGLTIRTTFDLDAQKAARRALDRQLARENDPNAKADADGEPAGKGDPVEGALVALRAKDGSLIALVGGSAFSFQNQFDRAVDGRRLMGSAVKPFVYGTAFESGAFTPDSKILDAPITFRIPGGRRWSPHNYGNRYFGEVTLAEALHKSLNSVAVRLLQQIDIDHVIQVLSEATGVPRAQWPRNLSLALGSADVSPLQMARAYAVFVRGGVAATPWWLREVDDRDGKVLIPSDAPAAPGVQVFKPETCRTTVAVMKGVLAPGGTAYGPARRTGFTIPAAGKTGTTNDYRDAWFAGVTPDLAAAVWVGHDDNAPMPPGKAG
ncbi:MAG: transglycosylase domain-containing protein, partial [Elusimicrobia bacterium]|nr:transglycosylase domain-containing protein [Elusimicrobiota bacterium]